ncbi:hypothetical protein [Paenibacillus abyssi]|uniref:Uncharacterized protein n=1 Tax=Paenibacillus abyssi TaxID=1340531 RepID=A0A917G1W9_9BACL|nr:hypothetical protein [Paenibacillus abyssi]GGG18762.1 hypothetical protein GCM10010916_39440 [Paenibacillus abyssi]
MEGSTPMKNIIIAIPDVKFAEDLKKRLELKGLKTIEIIVVLDHLLSTIEQKTQQSTSIFGIIISSSLAKNIHGKRLELLSDTMLTIRERYSEIQFIFLSDETDGHPLLAELISFGIYNIFTRNSSRNLNTNEFVDLLQKPKVFSDVKHLREINTDIQWRNRPAGALDGARSININLTGGGDSKETTAATKEPVVIEKERIIERERIIEKPVVQIVEKVKEIKVPPKLVVIGSAYSGAGSTFITMAISRILHYIGINNAVVEHPAADSVLYSLLFGDSKCPKDYKFLSEQVQQNGVLVNRSTEWVDGNSSWYPAPPEGLKHINEWTSDSTLKLLYHVKEPIVLLDVSHRWSEPSIKDICLGADELFFIVDPLMPVRFYRKETKQNTDILFEVRNMGKAANIIANRDVNVPNRKEWLGSLPLTPISVVPELPYSSVISSIWGGKMIADDEELQDELIYALYGVLKRIVPPNYPLSHLKKRRRAGLIGKLFGGSGG